MSDRPIFDALHKPVVIPTDVPEGLSVGVEVTEHDKGASVQANHDFGKPGGLEGGVQASWWESTGAAIKGWLTWTPRKK